MRIAPVTFFVTAALLASSAFAQDTATVTAIETELSSKQTELDNFTQILDKHIAEESRLQSQLELLRQRSSELEKEKNQALDAMNEMYRRLIDDPSLDISAAQGRYQQAVATHKQNKDDIALQLGAIAGQRKEIEQIRVAKHTLVNTLESLKDQLSTARVERLRNEFTREGTLEIEHTVNCKRTETLAACEQRGQQLGLQKATKRFIDQVFANLSEQRTVEPKRNIAGAQVQVMSSHVVNSSFSGQGNYSVNLSVTMRGDINGSRLCSLLNIDNRFCAEYGTPLAIGYQPSYPSTFSDTQINFSDEPGTASFITPASNNEVVSVAKLSTPAIVETVVKKTQPLPEKKTLVELTIRSNVLDDEVFINGVSFGSTKLVTSLAPGLHNIEIRKLGYETYSAQLDLKKAKTLRAKLVKKPEAIAAATPTAKTATNVVATDNKPQNKVVVIPAGQFKMGDLTGNGLANERPVVEKVLSHSFAMQSTEVTVAQFRQFIERTGFVTESEKSKGCAYYKNGEPVWEIDYNWKNPGYTQQENFPVVCVSYEDAKAYSEWLSGETGLQYRLPNEVEWEYAARAGKDSEYPWGNEIGRNLANCGWCGSEWSNKSPAAVAEFAPNGFGLYDTVGNVWEWTQKRASQEDVTVRGGAWNFAPSLARVSTRLTLAPDFRANYIGFRLIRER
ncbi:SUMF1/EgtB/PvdO family nonheme iron enzyme [Pseudoalteromonas fenneropenaei]|uniref:SUMF1/EgtB/PvdO family nonheme iron enzyme n=1 Tax=Pseudoalteromonas fenneropenaei TaxID=1737459 RepID=A0ABV7CKE2_9GAMM